MPGATPVTAGPGGPKLPDSLPLPRSHHPCTTSERCGASHSAPRLTGAAIGAVPAVASAGSSCVYNPNDQRAQRHGRQRRQPAADRPRERRQPHTSPSTTASARRIFCTGAHGTFAQVDNTNQIDISGPITNTTDGYVIDESGGTPRPRGHAGAERRLRDRDRGVHQRRRARLAERARRHRSRQVPGGNDRRGRQRR